MAELEQEADGKELSWALAILNKALDGAPQSHLYKSEMDWMSTTVEGMGNVTAVCLCRVSLLSLLAKSTDGYL